MRDFQGSGTCDPGFAELLELIRTLRSDNGCPWDRKQTTRSFHHYILEEYHEFVEALNEGSREGVIDEMGDLIFLVVFVAYMLEQEGFGLLRVTLGRAVEKMRRRHPHVFGELLLETSDQVVDNWSRIKATESTVQKRRSLLDGIPRTLPALTRAHRLAQRAATVGFDWNDAREVFRKVDEELTELTRAAEAGNPDAVREEVGDLFFVVANAARHLGVNSEDALNETSDKFQRRFRYIEEALRAEGRSVEDAGLEEMDRLWDQAKAREK
ncbi:MAG: nucleoside triphosphate pyrophosphohydrolase [Thermodesulfobacteriota bacterium]